MSLTTEFKASHNQFDFTKYESPYEIPRVEIIRSLIQSGSGKNAVDVGCGPGYFSRELSRRGFKTTAIDTGRENLESAKNYAAETDLGHATSILSRQMDDHYDLALSLELIEHMPKDHGKQMLEEIRRVLKPDGRLIISTPNRYSVEGLGGYYWGEKIRGWEKWTAWESTHVHIYSSIEILRLLRATGFIVDRVIGYYYEGPFPLVGHLKLPFRISNSFPLNRLGFNTIIECHKRGLKSS